ncbi:class I SAM-dependent methyltransferase [Aeromicrobium sp. 9AM]|uniref:class I SAM-dependent methyltransferase n=1 Tax=Aeromicrobium sp. 9AM TaxID=2653126 RepID=UPI00135AFE65|nr:class I SAM-dependent methyltransferase [Aeromicrobium sp. 9AM]
MTASDWSSVAASWEAHSAGIEETSATVTEALLAAAAIAPGENVLELSAGTGHLATHLVELVGPDGSLVASDVAPEFVAVLERRLANAPTASVATIDAAAIAGPPAAHDAVVCRMGLMFVPEPVEALREIRRVLRPGGRLAATVWGTPDNNPWMVSVGFATMMTGLLNGPMPTEPGGPFSLGDPDELEKLAREAGFGDVSVEVVSYTRRYASADELFDMVRVLAPPIAAALANASPQQLAAARTTAADFITQYRCDDGSYDVPACALVLLAS